MEKRKKETNKQTKNKNIFFEIIFIISFSMHVNVNKRTKKKFDYF